MPSPTAGECKDLADYRAELEGPHGIPQINLDLDASAAQVRDATRTLNNMPLTVITAGKSEGPACFPAEVSKSQDQAWLKMQDELATLSTNSRHVVVVDEIRRVVEAVQHGGRLSTP